MEEKHQKWGTMDPSQIDGEPSVLDKNPKGWPKNYWSDPIWEWVVRHFELDCRREVVIKIAKIIYMGIGSENSEIKKPKTEKNNELERDLLPQATILACIVAGQFHFENDIPIAPIRKCCEKISIDIRNVLVRILGMKNKSSASDREIDTWRTLSLTKASNLKINLFEEIIRIPEHSEDVKFCLGENIKNFAKISIFNMGKNRLEVSIDYISDKMLKLMNSKRLNPEVRFVALNQALLFSHLKHSDFMILAFQILDLIPHEKKETVEDQKIAWFTDMILQQRFK